MGVKCEKRTARFRMQTLICVLVALCFWVQAIFPAPVAAAPSLFETPQVEGPALPPSAKPDDGRYDVALGFFELLFKRRTPKKEKDTKKSAKPVVKAPTAPVIKTVPKDPDAFIIAVFGDEFSQDIAWGLKDAFAKTPDVKIEIYSKPNSGIVYHAQNNPLGDAKAFLKAHPFNFAVVMVGLNDRREMPERKDAEGNVVTPAYEFRTDGWARAYQREIDRVRLAFAEQDKPIFWVGLPPVGNEKLADDMRYLNDLVSSRLTERDEEFIDIWDAFSDEEGNFSFRGPDLTGQDVRLRLKNAIRFTSEGRRKLAFYVEKLVVRVLSQSVDEDVLPKHLAKADETALREGLGARRDIFALRKPPLGSDELINPSVFALSFSSGGSAARQLSDANNAPKHRADNFSWSGQ
nr:hypothetical protein [uncultured Cohaesibacter sp.]